MLAPLSFCIKRVFYALKQIVVACRLTALASSWALKQLSQVHIHNSP